MSKNDHLISVSPKIECIMHKDIEEDSAIIQIVPMRLNPLKNFIFFIIVLLTGGIFLLLCFWIPELRIKLAYSEAEVKKSTKIYVASKYYKIFTDLSKISSTVLGDLIIFKYQELPYYYDGNRFKPLFFDSHLPSKFLVDTYSHGYNDQNQINDMRILYGECLILVPVIPLCTMIITTLLNPFYVFQIYSVILWYFEDYYQYSIAIVVITTISFVSNITTVRKGMIALHNLAKRESIVKVMRNRVCTEISSVDLVVGDLVEIAQQMTLPCDLCLISGGCIVEEGMLTGESVPVLKDSIPYLDDYIYDPDSDKRHTLYEGTKVIQTRNYSGTAVNAVVVRTNFLTAKGKLVRSIMYPKPTKFKLYEDAMKFLLFLASLTLVGFMICLPRMIYLDFPKETIAIRALDLVTITVPPALPACMAAGISFALHRLSKQKIFCIDQNRVNVAGRIEVMVFDKTGTLTEDGMNLLGVQSMRDGTLQEISIKPKVFGQNMIECMATCHSLAIINNQLLGDTQDLQIFNGTGWKYEEPEDEIYDPLIKAIVRPEAQGSIINAFDADGRVSGLIEMPYEIGILHTFHFTSKLKRMAVIVKNLKTNELFFYTKGAPEVLIEKCIGVPMNINHELAQYTRRGYRVIACAYRMLPSIKYNELKSIKLESLENDLIFLGLIILQNKLKPQTLPALDILNSANIRTIMATGDAVLTGISVARECKLLESSLPVYLGELLDDEIAWQIFDASEEPKNISNLTKPPWIEQGVQGNYVLALTGLAFVKLLKDAEDSHNDKKVVKVILEKCEVFARMAPEHKTLLVEKLQEQGFLVGMCGDGANDCGALKAADVGISLSEADSSIAAPFTSQIPDISSVILVLKEGRCALTTSIQCFKFMALYSMIQFTTASFLYWFLGNMTNNQYSIADLFTVMPLAIFMSKTDPYPELSPHQPTSELISLRVLSSVSIQAFIQLVFQIGTYIIAINTYYEYPNLGPGDNPGNVSYEDTIVFYMSWFEYLVICIVFSIGKPWKKPSYTNKLLTIYQVIVFVTILVFLFEQNEVTEYLIDVILYIG